MRWNVLLLYAMRGREIGVLIFSVLLLHGCGSKPPGAVAVSAGSTDPRVESVTPSNGTGASQVFTITFKAPNALVAARVLFNADKDGRNACYVYFVPSDKQFLLVSDSGDSSTVLSGKSAENAQCELRSAGSYATVESGKVTLKLDLSFKPLFAGTKVVYGFAEDAKGQTMALTPIASWTVPK